MRYLLAAVVSVLTIGRAVADDGPHGKLTLPRTDVLYLAGYDGGGLSLGLSRQAGTKPLMQRSIDGLPTGGTSRSEEGLIFETTSGRERSIPMAFALSAVVPGAGQVYNGSWWKAGVAVAAEAALITAYVSWKNKGSDGRDVYKAYAHANWSPIKYAEWLNAYDGYSGPDVQLPSVTAAEFMHPDAWTAAQRAEVDAFFNNIRAAERQTSYLTTGAAFSHVLPYFGEQQYYELIGKYFQFAPGWHDYDFAPDDDAETVMPPDAQFYYYAGIHADANDYLRKSSWAGAFVIVNHFLAAVDAAVSAKLHNMSLTTKTALKTGPLGEPMATAGMVLGF